MASQPIYKYERDDGTILYGLTMEQALEEEAKDKALRQQQETDAKLGPQIAAGIHAYESQQQQTSKGPQQPFQAMGNTSSSPMSAMSSSGPSQNTNPAPNVTISRFGEDGFMESVNSAVEQQKRETPSPFEGTPASDSLFSSLSSSSQGSGSPMSAMQDSGMPRWTPDKNGNMPESYYQNQQASKDYAALTKGIPPEAMEQLHARWRMGEFGKNPSTYYAELLETRRIFDKARAENEKEEFKAKLKKDEKKNTAFYTTEDKLLQLDSQERMNTADNQTTLEAARIGADSRAKTAGSGNEKDIFNREYKLRSQYNQLSKNYNVIKDAFGKIEVSSKLKNASGDMALVYGFMRLQDPTSTVREGEYATAENARGVPESILNLYNKTIKGTKLSDRQREEFVSTAQYQYQLAEQNQVELNSQYREIASMYNLDPDRVMGGTVMPGQSSGAGAGGNVIKSKSGNVYNLD